MQHGRYPVIVTGNLLPPSSGRKLSHTANRENKRTFGQYCSG